VPIGSGKANYGSFLQPLMDDLSRARIEIDLVEMSGGPMDIADNRVMALRLVERQLADAAFFAPGTGAPQIAMDVLRKRNVLLQRGSYHPLTRLNEDMVISSASQFFCDPTKSEQCVLRDDAVVLLEMTTSDLREDGTKLDWTESYEDFLVRTSQDFLGRVDTITGMGYTAMVSSYFEYFRLATFLRTFTREAIVIVMGVPSLRELFRETYYTNLDGGILEAFGRLLRFDLKIYAYPTMDPGSDSIVTADTLKVDPEVQLLYDFLLQRGTIMPVTDFDADILHTFGRCRSQDIKDMVASEAPNWEDMVPKPVADMIKSDRGAMMGYKK